MCLQVENSGRSGLNYGPARHALENSIEKQFPNTQLRDGACKGWAHKVWSKCDAGAGWSVSVWMN